MVLYTGEFKGSDPFEWPNFCLGRFEIIDVVDDASMLCIDHVDSRIQLALPDDRHGGSLDVFCLVGE